MDFDNIKIGLARVQSLVEGWENAGVTELERDLALDELRRVYSEIRFGGTAVANEPAAESAAAVIPAIVAEESAPTEEIADEEESEEPEIEVELIMPDEEELEEEASTETESEQEPTEQEKEVIEEPEAILPNEPAEEEPELPEMTAEQPEDNAEEPETQSVEETIVEIEDTADDVVETHNEPRKTEQSLFGDEEIIRPRASRRRVIMSLYDDDMPIIIPDSTTDSKPEAETKSEPVAEPSEEPVKESAPEPAKKHTEQSITAERHTPTVAHADTEDVVLGDVLRADIHTLGDSIARPKGIAESAPVASLREAIGINDRFLLIRDLFDNDETEYEKAIVALDSFDDLDDCMIHIVENYSWRSSSDGAKLIMDLIQRKFRK